MDNILVDNLFMFYMRGVRLFIVLKRASSCSLNFKCIKLIKPMKSSYCKLGYSSIWKHKEIHVLAICNKCNYPLKIINLGVIIYFFLMGNCVRVRLFVIWYPTTISAKCGKQHSAKNDHPLSDKVLFHWLCIWLIQWILLSTFKIINSEFALDMKFITLFQIT